MKRALWLVTVALTVTSALAACRTIVGIEDLENGFGPQGPGGGPEGGPDGGGMHEGGGPPPWDGGLTDAQRAMIDLCVGKANGCRPCCKSGFGIGPTFDTQPTGRACMCRPETCGTESACKPECDDGGRIGAGGGTGTPTSCIKCIDDQLAGSVPCVEETCGADQDCHAGLACFRECPPP